MANALACEFVIVTDFIEAFLRAAYAERHTQNALLALGEQVKRVAHLLAEIFLLEPGVGGGGVVVGQNVEKAVAVVGLSKWSVDRHRFASREYGTLYFVNREVEQLGKFVLRWTAFVLLLKGGNGFVDAVECAHLIHGQAHEARLLSHGLENGLTNPPHSVRNKFEAISVVEFLSGFDEPDIALID